MTGGIFLIKTIPGNPIILTIISELNLRGLVCLRWYVFSYLKFDDSQVWWHKSVNSSTQEVEANKF
jgi:hypothetical protein